ncbi:TetR family transcriptional regulator [Streptomyces cuspidosporus]|uniref:TetR family transcriptional regulator n=1 Tax=Streptomyces cuspidosporus TaxID=66882 RepID=A0ABN3FLV3_9ACTN
MCGRRCTSTTAATSPSERAPSSTTTLATGHADPQRRERILTAALDLIADEGIARVSHRRIAARAGVPLGSMTHHFSGMDDLLREAFDRFTDHIVAVFDAYLSTPADPGPGSGGGGRPRPRPVRGESARPRPHPGAVHPRRPPALIEGLILHRALAREPHGRALTLEAIARITAPGTRAR